MLLIKLVGQDVDIIDGSLGTAKEIDEKTRRKGFIK